MDFDTALLRSFVTVAEHLHIGRAAEQMFLTQQALSRRIAGLEEKLGVRLFDRTGHGLVLTSAGHRFSEPARNVLDMMEAAIGAARDEQRLMRVDVWGRGAFPTRAIREIGLRYPELGVEFGMHNGLEAALGAVRRHEIDVVAGRTGDSVSPWPASLRRRLLRLEPLVAVVGERHSLARSPAVRPIDFATSVLQGTGRAPEMRSYLEQFALRFGVPADLEPADQDEDDVLERLRDCPGSFALVPLSTGRRIPGTRFIRVLDPTPVFPWSFAWHERGRHPALARLLHELDTAGREQGWLRYDPERHWLPEADYDDLRDTRCYH